jgi:hypothetical protein
MQSREKLLAIVVGGLLALLVAHWLFNSIRGSFVKRWNDIAALEGQIEEKLTEEARGKRAALLLAHWQHRSLPSDVGLAETLYRNHLLELAAKNKLSNAKINPGRGDFRKNVYDKLVFTMTCKGSLEQMVSFLYDFYSGNHLHKLRELSIKPGNNARELDLSLAIEALVLPGADRKDALNEERGDRLVHATLAAYSDPIVKRNLFAEYAPPPPPKPLVQAEPETKPPLFDPAKFAVLTGVLQVGDQPQAWITVRTTGELLKLNKGDQLKVGEFQGTVTRIDTNCIELESGGKRRLLALGKTLAQATDAATAEESGF